MRYGLKLRLGSQRPLESLFAVRWRSNGRGPGGEVQRGLGRSGRVLEAATGDGVTLAPTVGFRAMATVARGGLGPAEQVKSVRGLLFVTMTHTAELTDSKGFACRTPVRVFFL